MLKRLLAKIRRVMCTHIGECEYELTNVSRFSSSMSILLRRNFARISIRIQQLIFHQKYYIIFIGTHYLTHLKNNNSLNRIIIIKELY